MLRIFLSETYVIEDCLYAYLDEWTYNSNSTSDRNTRIDDSLSLNLPSQFILDFEYKGSIRNGRFGLIPANSSSTGQPNYYIVVQVASNDYVGVWRDTSTHGLDSGRLSADNTVYNQCRLSIQNNVFTCLLGGTNSATANVNYISTHNPYTIGIYTFNTGTNSVRNIKLKPL